jgi:RNA polymerase sigma factor (sigma-70 family)
LGLVLLDLKINQQGEKMPTKRIRSVKSISSDAWRYASVGFDNYILDRNNIENPENKIIEIIDGTAKEEPDLNVWAAIESLPDRYKNLLLEYFFEGMTLEQMGKSRKVTKQFMHQELKRAIIEIKKLM